MVTQHQKDMSRLYQKALRILRSEFHEDFKRILGDVYEEEGVTVRRRRTSEEIEADRIAEAKALLGLSD